MSDYRIKAAVEADAPEMADMFLEHISANPEYISHGEMQMGVATGSFPFGELKAEPSLRAREIWLRYILSHINADGWAKVFTILSDPDSDDGSVIAFCVVSIQSDEGSKYGMVCDVLVKDSFRGLGLGSHLLDKAVEWLHSQGINEIYLESGKNNHSAHAFFRKRGFAQVSEIFKLGK